MSANSSSSSSDSFLRPNLSDNLIFTDCLTTKPGSTIFASYMITYIFLILPLSIFIIYNGLQQWRQKRSTSSAATMSHSDCFTYHMVTMELIGVSGCILYRCGSIYSDLLNLTVGFFFMSFAWYGQIVFHALTCVERYLAVVHPITYLSLRKERGIRIRNISIGCVWMICIVGTVLLLNENAIIFVYFCLLIPSLTIVSFCSLSVLCALIRPGPGELGGGRKRVDQSKQRAFYTIMVILGVLVVRFSWNLALTSLYVVDMHSQCVIRSIGMWFFLPSALVLPLLYLHRAGKLVCCKNNIQRE